MAFSAQTVPTQFVDVDGDAFAYRRLGTSTGVPLVFLHHFTAILDDWDPRVVDGLAASRPVILFDNRGVGGSEGVTPNSVDAMGRDAILFLDKIGVTYCDILGFSMGGFIAQWILEHHPSLVRKAILAGTGPAGGEHNTKPQMIGEVRELAASQGKHPKQLLFFTQTDNGQDAADAYMARLSERTLDKDTPVTEATIAAHLAAIVAWGDASPQDLSKIEHPVFVANGDDDMMVPTLRSFELLERLPYAELSIFPDAGHGGIFQHHAAFLEQAVRFLK